MKKHILLLLSILISASQAVNASHGIGGEITWQCQGNGQYIFQLKFYRDCNGIAAPGSVFLNTTHPSFSTIPMMKIAQNDISPNGYLANGADPCPNCNPPTGVYGLVEEHIFESNPVTLQGVPPVNGWEFSWGECCRSSSISNLSNPGTLGFSFRAIMYPHNNLDAFPCYDSSPRFIERPNSIVCTGLPIVYHHMAADEEYDSLYYELTNPLDDMGANLNFAPGYSVQQPLPDPVTMNPGTGELSFTSTTGGYYVLVNKVSAYKCGSIVAEIRREITLVIDNNCPAILGGTQNTAPDLNPPFYDSTSSSYVYADTVIAGDTLNFDLVSSDFDMFTNGALQTIIADGFGLQYGAGFTDPASGCLIPPCATISQGLPYSAQAGIYLDFNWQTDPAHLGYSFNCVQFSNTYYFLSKNTDNYCPANASNSRVFSITVLPAIPKPAVVDNGGTLECIPGVNIVSSGVYTFQWFLNEVGIPGATGNTFTPVQTGIYHALAIAPDGQGNYSEPYLFDPLNINEISVINSLNIHPNPSFDGFFELEVQSNETGIMEVSVSDLLGRKIVVSELEINPGLNAVRLDLNTYSRGMYFVNVSFGNATRSLKVTRD